MVQSSRRLHIFLLLPSIFAFSTFEVEDGMSRLRLLSAHPLLYPHLLCKDILMFTLLGMWVADMGVVHFAELPLSISLSRALIYQDSSNIQVHDNRKVQKRDKQKKERNTMSTSCALLKRKKSKCTFTCNQGSDTR